MQVSGTDDRLFTTMLADVEAGRLAAQRRDFTKGEVVFHEGDLGDTLHLIVGGMFAVKTATPAGGHLIIDVLGRGEIFGEFAVFSDEGRRTTGIGALTDGATVVVQRDHLLGEMRLRPELSQQLLAMVIERADGTRRRLVELLHVPADLRVLRALLTLARFEEEGTPIPVTQGDLASFAATTRPTANKVLRDESRTAARSKSREAGSPS